MKGKFKIGTNLAVKEIKSGAAYDEAKKIAGVGNIKVLDIRVVPAPGAQAANMTIRIPNDFHLNTSELYSYNSALVKTNAPKMPSGDDTVFFLVRATEGVYVIADKSTLATSLSLDKTAHSMKVSESYKLIPTISPDSVTNKKIYWSSSNERVAIVDKSGIVAAIRPGKAVITAKTINGIAADCEITVNGENAQDQYFDIRAGELQSLLANFSLLQSSLKLASVV